ncbi:MAG: [Oscillospiraceae bacterium]|nr:[FeFe] hydrogenase, group A [Oscillospiraceae bacterium]
GARGMAAACVQPCEDGMEITTNSAKVLETRKKNLELILSTHEKKCLSCVRSDNCELQQLCREAGVDEDAFSGAVENYELDTSSAYLVRDNNKCVLCRRCVAVCNSWQGIGAIGAAERGFKTHIATAFERPLGDVSCVGCGQCINVCPTGALREVDHTAKVWAALQDPEKIVISAPAPAIRATLGECFGMPVGTDVEGKLAASLRRLGFDKVFDTDFAADLTIMEEATEFLERVNNGGTLPLITSCSPGWIKYCEHYYPEFIDNLSSCKSPMQMLGATVKTYYAQKMGIDPAKLFVVGIMPCTAKKFEMGRDDEDAAGYPDVDAVLTTRELGRMIKTAGIDFVNLPDEEFDNPLGMSTGAAVIFGATGGVMEAALRTAVEVLTGEELKNLNFEAVRGMDGVKEASYEVAGLTVNIAVASGLENAKKVLESVKSGEKNYHFIEIMACPGGCINGGGQPTQPAEVRNFVDLKSLRAAALYANDEAKTIRKSHENPVIKAVYDEFFEKPGSHKAHEILHTHYVKRDRF